MHYLVHFSIVKVTSVQEKYLAWKYLLAFAYVRRFEAESISAKSRLTPVREQNSSKKGNKGIFAKIPHFNDLLFAGYFSPSLRQHIYL